MLCQLRDAQAASWRQGRRVLVEDYLQQYPELDADLPSMLTLVTCEAMSKPIIEKNAAGRRL